jgi:putative DNA methylase
VKKNDVRLIEDYLPIEEIGLESGREKSTRKGHISTLHLWWARRPLVASRAAVYAALVPTCTEDTTIQTPTEIGARYAQAKQFITTLCTYPGQQSAVSEAQTHILQAHAERLSNEIGQIVTQQDIEAGEAPRPIVLDMFAGGGALPLEALRLGCQAISVDLNPVAFIIEMCTLVYPQKYSKPNSSFRGCGPDTTWAGLAEEVQHWGTSILHKVEEDLGDLYPLIHLDNSKRADKRQSRELWDSRDTELREENNVVPVVYLWTRTVTCKNPACGGTVPLARQTWLCKTSARYAALKPIPDKRNKCVRYEVVEATTAKGLGFDPNDGSQRGNATCPFCGTVADSDYLRGEGCAGRMRQQLMGIVCTRPGETGKLYFSADQFPRLVPDNELIAKRIETITKGTGLTVPSEPLPKPGTLGFRIQPYGMLRWGDLFTPRQLLSLLTFIKHVHAAEAHMKQLGYEPERIAATITYLGLVVDRVAMFGNTLCAWYYQEQAVSGSFARQALPMFWDFAEVSLRADISGGIKGGLTRIVDAIGLLQGIESPATVRRSAAQECSSFVQQCDAVITDPPYYDNIPYADLSDFFYVWLKRSIGHLYPEHFASELTPKRNEAIAEPMRYGGSKEAARHGYERMMAEAFREAYSVLKSQGIMVVVYAHKTTLGWTTLVEALRSSGFAVMEAWPIDTEGPGRLRAHDSAALASSIFLVARKRQTVATGQYETDVRPELETIVQERVQSLWEAGISGADLVIACLGAGLRAFTRYAKVEYANGEEVPAERFLAEVETVVLETIFARLSKDVGKNSGRYSLAGVDPSTRFYTLWRYTYRFAELESGEAIVFANGTHVELDGVNGLSLGARPLVEKLKNKYRLLDYTERGDDAELGMPSEDGQPAPLVDALHRLLWLMERHPSGLGEFLREARPNTEQLRLVAQALAGPALKGGELGEVATATELAALTKLTANWHSVVEDVADEAVGTLFRGPRKNK